VTRARAPRVGASAPKVGALVLAAGLSRRMDGANKLLADVGGKPLVARAVDAVLASPARPVVVVTGHEAERMRAALAGRAVRFAHNPAFEAGLSASLRTGLAALGGEVEAALVCLGDMPSVRAEHLAALIAAFEASGRRAICAPRFEGRRGNPVLWPARFFPEMGALGGDAGARALLDAHASEVCYVPVADAGVVLDVDTPEALAALRDEGRA
jgi:molybdenum cofactor cytidylyltransferase